MPGNSMLERTCKAGGLRLGAMLAALFAAFALFLALGATTVGTAYAEEGATIAPGGTIVSPGEYTLQDDAGTGGTITVECGSEDEPVVVIGNGSETVFQNIKFDVKNGSCLTIRNLFIKRTTVDNFVDYPDGGGFMVQGTCQFYSDLNAIGKAYIHVPAGKTLTLSGDEDYEDAPMFYLYAYWRDSSAIGASSSEGACGNITFKSGTWFLKKSKNSTVIGGYGTDAKNGDITFEGGEVYVKDVSGTSSVGGMNKGSDVYVKNGAKLIIFSDWSSIAIYGGQTADPRKLVVEDGALLKCQVSTNSQHAWSTGTDSTCYTDTTIKAQCDKSLVYFDALKYIDEETGEVIVKEGDAILFQGTMNSYVTNEVKNPDSGDMKDYLKSNWMVNDESSQLIDPVLDATGYPTKNGTVLAPDGMVSLWLEKGKDHTVTVSDGTTSYDSTYVWDASTGTFSCHSTSIALDRTSIEAEALSDPIDLTATVTPVGSTDLVKWTSSNPAVATVGERSGRVTPLTAGTCTITATTNDLTATCNVTVTASPWQSTTWTGGLDFSWYDEESIGSTAYTISTPMQFQALAWIVSGDLELLRSGESGYEIKGTIPQSNFSFKKDNAICTITLANDIDMGGVYDADTDTWTMPKPYKPIGSLESPFRGTFQGNATSHYVPAYSRDDNAKISGLYMTGTSYVGLFGYLGSGPSSGTVKDLKLEGSLGTASAPAGGTDEGCVCFGAVAGCSEGSVYYVDSAVSVYATGSEIGGLVGYAKASASGATSLISQCTCTGSVTARVQGDAVGGICGKLETCTGLYSPSATMRECSCSGTVVAYGTSESEGVGGLVGTATSLDPSVSANITFCYCLSDTVVNGTTESAEEAGAYAGGLVGYAPYANISQCYSLVKDVRAKDAAGILIGKMGSGSFAHLFYETAAGGTTATATTEAGESTFEDENADGTLKCGAECGAGIGAAASEGASVTDGYCRDEAGMKSLATAASLAQQGNGSDASYTMGYCWDNGDTPVNNGYPVNVWQGGTKVGGAIANMALSIGQIDDIEYTGDDLRESIAANLAITLGDEAMTANMFTITYAAEGGAAVTEVTNPGAYTVSIAGKPLYLPTSKTASGTVTVTKGTVATAEVNVSDQHYTGSQIKPTGEGVVVMKGDKLLTQDTDYVIDPNGYGANIDAGTGTLTITGTGNYEGTQVVEFNILANDFVVSQPGDVVYTGSKHEPAVTVTAADEAKTPLTEGTHYTVSYGENTAVGEGSVTVTGLGIYAAAQPVVKVFAITVADASGAVIADIPAQTYTGSALTPVANVTLEGYTIAASDYDVAYENNVNVGAATVTVVFKGNFEGSVSKNFSIAAADASGATVVCEPASYQETGEAIVPTSVKVELAGFNPVAGTDYDLTYENNVEPGTATAKAVFKGNFAGTASAAYTIVATYDVSFDKGHASVTGDAPVLGVQVEGAKITVPSADALAYEGHSFIGWECSADGQTYAAGDAYTMPASDVVFTAQWELNYVPGENPVAGDDRYETAAKIATTAFPEGSEGVVVATGENFPDALAASSLAGMLDWPVVLTKSSDLESATLKTIEDLGASKAVIVGGANAVSTGVESALKSTLTGGVDRISGTDRYDTAVKVYEYGRDKVAGAEWGSTAIVATGKSYPDALSISGYAFKTKSPIFLTDPDDGMADGTLAALKDGDFDGAIIVGGTSAVKNADYETVKAACGNSAERLSGDDRYATSKAIASFCIQNGCTADGACIATGANFPDALAGGALAGRTGSIMLLGCDDDCSAFGVMKGAGVGHLYYLGGTASVTPVMRAAAQEAAGLK